MPWCEHCTRFWTPTSMQADGSCPTCGRVIAEAKAEKSVPWHFKLLLLAITVYLGWRAWQGLAWLAHHI